MNGKKFCQVECHFSSSVKLVMAPLENVKSLRSVVKKIFKSSKLPGGPKLSYFVMRRKLKREGREEQIALVNIKFGE